MNKSQAASDLRGMEFTSGSSVFRRFKTWMDGAPLRVPMLYLAFLTLAEAVTTLVEPRFGMVLHGICLVSLILHGVLFSRSRVQYFLLGLSLSPLIRLLSLTMPLPEFPYVYWYMVVGLPLFMASFLLIRFTNLSHSKIGINTQSPVWQVLIGFSGIFLGFLEYLILRPVPLIDALRVELILVPALILFVFTGFLEELIFRGILQYFSIRNLGRWGLFYMALVFAVLHMGYQSVLDVIFVFVVAMFFGYVVQRTGSILGVTVAHGITNISLFLIFPFLITSPTSLPDKQEIYGIYSQPENTTPIVAPLLEIIETPKPQMTPTITVTITATPLPDVSATEKPRQPTSTDRPQDSPTPESQNCAPPAGWVVYVVQPGDTLYSIGVSVGVSVSELQRANCLESTFIIRVGQQIYVPVSPNPTATVTQTLMPTSTPKNTATFVPTKTRTPAPPSDTPVPTRTVTSTATRTITPPAPNTPTPTGTPTQNIIPTLTPTLTPTVE